jgi:asparagine synthetase B (glutamine-hydrolysing)
MALYFASRGVGNLHDNLGQSSSQYTSPARVLLSGLGSDELLGGYSRHRGAFRANGWGGLNDEASAVNIEHDDRRILNSGSFCCP